MSRKSKAELEQAAEQDIPSLRNRLLTIVANHITGIEIEQKAGKVLSDKEIWAIIGLVQATKAQPKSPDDVSAGLDDAEIIDKATAVIAQMRKKTKPA